MIDTTTGADVTDANDPAVKAARAKFEEVLKDLPGPSPDQQLRPKPPAGTAPAGDA
jgi:hypothetical protein